MVSRDGNYKSEHTIHHNYSCIYNSNPRSRFKLAYFQRHPDLIIAGAKRCGAGPLKMFLDAHPNIKFRYDDAHFFDKGDKKRKKWIYKL